MKTYALGIVGFWGLCVALCAGIAYGAESPPANAAALNRIPDTRYELHGIVQEYISAVTDNWLLRMPNANPAVLQMFADRDKLPHRDLLPWSGEFAGKYLTGATQVLRLTHDPRLREYVAQFVANLVRLQAEDGYLGPFPQDQRLKVGWDVWGHYHIMLGLLLWHEETGDPEALRCAVKIGDLLCRTFLHSGRRIVDDVIINMRHANSGVEMNHAAIHSLCLLYRVTQTPAYLELACQIADEEFKDKRAGDFVQLGLAGKEFFQGPKPRWESLHSIQGIAELYWITGNEDYRKAFEQLWQSIAKFDRHNNGGFSSGEQAQGDPYHPGAIETCCTVAWMAMSVDMLRLTGRSVVADELELSTYNQVLGYQHRDGKWCTYNTPMDGVRRDGTKAETAFQRRPGSEQVNCCSANAPRGLGMISDWALMTDGQALALNWYGPSTITATLKGVAVTLVQATNYPRDGRILLSVSPEQETRFPLKLRIPHWSARTGVRVNGQPVTDVKPGAYLILDRVWKRGDSVQIDLDMSLHYWTGQRECQGKTSIYRGPLLLVYELARKWPEPDPLARFSPGWKHLGQSSVSREIGAFFETCFDGTTITWRGNQFDDAGRAQVTIDGKDIAIVDQYGPKRGEAFKWLWRDLAPGEHTLRLTVLEEKNPASRDRWLNVAGIEPPPYDGPVLDAATMDGKVLPVDYSPAPLLVMEVTDIDGKKVILIDYGTAGEGGVYYLSWLKLRHVTSAPPIQATPG